MELTNTSENSCNPTPKLKPSPIPINFVPFNQEAYNCFRCGVVYSETHLFKQKYCKNCLFLYIKNVTGSNSVNLECYWEQIECLNVRCNKHKANKNLESLTRNVQEWRDVCLDISYFGQIITEHCSGGHYIEYIFGNRIFCQLCERILHGNLLIVEFRLCADCYMIFFGWVESLYKKRIPILYLPWWDTFNKCLGCNLNLIFISGCQKWCPGCYIIHTGCRYCLTTNIIFGFSEKSQCNKCKRSITIDVKIISSGNYDIDEFLHSIKVDVDIGNHIVDYIENIKIDVNPLGVYDFIKENHTKPKLKLEWIPYTRLENFTKIAQSELGTIYRATCSDIRDHSSKFTVAVKCFSKSQDFKKYFLNESSSHYHCNKFGDVTGILHCHGITQNPNTNEYMLVMQDSKRGNLYDYLQKNIGWQEKIRILHEISSGLEAIHDADFIHCNLHSGNILYIQGWKIGDLGLSQPANNTLQSNDIYGAIPYIAPEIFNGDPYSKDSDIYSMGMIMWECASNRKPFADIEHDLIVKIINGLRPKVPKDTPEWLAELMRKCWHSDPSKRPSITMIRTTLKNNYKDDSLSEIKRPVSTEFSGKLPKVVTSRTLNSLMSRPSINSSSMNSNKMIQNQDDVTKEDKFDEYFNRLSIIYANSTNQNPSDTSAIYSSKQLIEDFGNLGIKSSDG